MATITADELINRPFSQLENEASFEDLPEINPHIHLSARDSQIFADLMEADEEPVEALRLAAMEYEQTINRQSL
jgi:hypothetical protein